MEALIIATIVGLMVGGVYHWAGSEHTCSTKTAKEVLMASEQDAKTGEINVNYEKLPHPKKDLKCLEDYKKRSHGGNGWIAFLQYDLDRGKNKSK